MSFASTILVVAGIVAAIAATDKASLAQASTAEPRRPLILVPSLLGSRLCRPNSENPAKPVVVWGTLGALTHFPTIRLPHMQANAGDVRPCGLVREIVYMGLFTQGVYAPVLAHLHRLGYREGHDLFTFDYDWRRSVFDNAELLAAFVREKIPDETRRVDILGHSMGGLIARVYAVRFGGSARLGMLMSAGTPFRGSVKVFETIEQGWGIVNPLMGGLAAFRRTMLSFASVFELMPRYDACCDGETAGTAAFDPAKVEAWRALRWAGVDPGAMPDLAATFARVRELQTIVESALPPEVEEVHLVGVDQRTSHRIVFKGRKGSTNVRVQTTWAGDGTVARESATIARVAVHPTSFADHERILHDPQIQEFLGVALTNGVAQAMRTVRVRPRSTIRTSDGSLTELVGVAVVPEQTIHRTGDKSKVHVHVRLGNRQALSPQMIRLTMRTPDGRETPIMLRPDAAASDPTNPFEQSFAGRFDAGARAGVGMLTAAVTVDDAAPRLVERPVLVVSP